MTVEKPFHINVLSKTSISYILESSLVKHETLLKQAQHEDQEKNPTQMQSRAPHLLRYNQSEA